jgi:aspartokinase-like uncharacterized kinase
MRVVKLGGSLYHWDRLPDCLSRLADRAVTIVPGGGPFADQVRQAQRDWRFDDATAHAMAVLGMAQFGRMLAGLEPRLTVAETLPELLGETSRGRSAIWLPALAELNDGNCPASWNVTSDSLALWLAIRIEASDLTLVKSVDSCESTDWLELSRHGIVDPAFAQSAATARFPINIRYREDFDRQLASLVVGAPHAPGPIPATCR